MTDQAYFVGVRSPEELRKNILNSTRTVITSLKRYEAYRDINTLKLGLLGDLKQTITEITLVNRFCGFDECAFDGGLHGERR